MSEPSSKYLNKKKPTLLVITTTFPRWKDDTDPPFVYELAKRLTNDFNVIVHTPHYTKSVCKEIISNIKVHRFRYFFSKYEKLAGQVAILPFLKKNKGYMLLVPFFLITQFFSLLLLIKKERPDIIHAHWLIPSGFIAILAGRKTPVVVTGHGADIFGLKMFPFRYLKQFVIKRARLITVVSNALKNEVLKIVHPNKPVEVIPMGVDSTMFNKERFFNTSTDNQDNVLELLFVGRLSEKKGVRYLLEAYALVRKNHKKIKLTIIGTGEEKATLLRLASLLKIDKHVTFAGAIPNHKLPEKYAQADIFIGPSITAKSGDKEGFGLTFIEASFSGCFLIGTNTGGIKDIIEDGITGLLAVPEDAKNLAEKICWAIEHPVDVKYMKKSALRTHLEKYEWSVIASRYSALLLPLCKNGLK